MSLQGLRVFRVWGSGFLPVFFRASQGFTGCCGVSTGSCNSGSVRIRKGVLTRVLLLLPEGLA